MVGPEITRRLPYYECLKVTPYQGFTTVILLGSSFLLNYMRKRPMSSSIPRHVAFAVAGLYAGNEMDKLFDARRNAKVLIIEDYIARHPEDFPLVTPKKYKDILVPWIPLR